MKTINILSGGDTKNLPKNSFENNENNWIAVDSSIFTLNEFNIEPLISIGDFDTAGNIENLKQKNKNTTFLTFDSKKDLTDTELAILKAIDLGYDVINIFGFSGKRLDHELSNLFLVLKKEFRNNLSKINFIDKNNIIFFLNPGRNKILKNNESIKYVAFFVLGSGDLFTIENAKYNLNEESIDFPVIFSSNEFLVNKNIVIETRKSPVMVVQSFD